MQPVGLYDRLERVSEYFHSPVPMFDDALFEKLNPIPARKILQARQDWNKLIQAGYQGPRDDIEKLLSELEAIIKE
jgi:hypothetical protein